MKKGTIAVKARLLKGRYCIRTEDVLITGNHLIRPGMAESKEYVLNAPFQRCLRGKGGKVTFQNSCLMGSFNNLSLINEPIDKLEKPLPVTGATGGVFPNPASDGGEDDDSVNVSIGGGD